MVALLLLPLRGLAYANSDMSDIQPGNKSCHSQSEFIQLSSQDQPQGTAHGCCDDQGLQHDCAHCLSPMTMQNLSVLTPSAKIYPLIVVSDKSLNSIPLEHPYKPPRLL